MLVDPLIPVDTVAVDEGVGNLFKVTSEVSFMIPTFISLPEIGNHKVMWTLRFYTARLKSSRTICIL